MDMASSASSLTPSAMGIPSITTTMDLSQDSQFPFYSSSSSGSSSGTSTPPASPLARWQAALHAWLAPGSGWNLSGARVLSHLLKEATAQAHKDVLRPEIVNKLITGQIPLETHILYLMMLYDVYEALETGLARHADDALLAAIYNPSILNRTQPISDDIAYLLRLSPSEDWQTHPLALQYRSSPPSALTDYVSRLYSLSKSSQGLPSPSKEYVYPPPPGQAFLLLAHAYVRYMGDLNGGQMIKDSVSKAYHLQDSAAGSDDGLRFYRFDNQEGERASPAELSKLTSWYRKGIDSVGRGLTAEQRAALLQEANHAFELNIRLFSSFSEDSTPETHSQDALVPPSLRSTAPHIPSPSLEGYAKAAAYMPEERISSIVRKKNASASPIAVRASKVARRTSTSQIQNSLLLLAVAVPLTLVLRECLKAFLLA